MDRAVVEALFDRGLDQPVLVDPREALELGGADDRPQVLAAAVFVDDLDRWRPGSAASIIPFSSARSAIGGV